MKVLRFRGALSPHVMIALLCGVIGGAAASFAGGKTPDWLPSPFFTAAIAVGTATFLWKYLATYRNSGVCVDDEGLWPGGLPELKIRFDAIEKLRLATREIRVQDKVLYLRHAVVESKGQELRFAELRHAPRDGSDVIDVADSGLLVALLAERLDVAGLLPDEVAAPTEPEPARTVEVGALARTWGMIPLLLKLGSKLVGLVGALFKFVKSGAVLVKPGWAAVSIAAYSIVFDWRFGLLLLFMIFWHEYGHVHAMRRVGVPVKGIYFVPLLGGAAVHNAPVTNRWHQVYVDLNGPLWGGLLAIAALVVYYATGGDEPFWAALASWWALINLFNLLPVLPLDGGRVMSALAFSLESQYGGLLVFAGLVFGGFLALVAGLELLALVAVIGALEFAGELSAARWRAILGALRRPERVDFATWRRLHGLTRAVSLGDDGPRAIANERAVYDRRRAIATGIAMTRRQFALAVAAYVGLAAALIATMLVVRDVPGADIANLLLRG